MTTIYQQIIIVILLPRANNNFKVNEWITGSLLFILIPKNALQISIIDNTDTLLQCFINDARGQSMPLVGCSADYFLLLAAVDTTLSLVFVSQCC